MPIKEQPTSLTLGGQSMNAETKKSAQYFDKVKKQNFTDDSESQKAFNFHKHLKNKLNAQQPSIRRAVSLAVNPIQEVPSEVSKITAYAMKVNKKLQQSGCH